jgi:cytochrome c553
MLAGQFDWYLVSQLKAIRDKVRVNKNTNKMYPFVKKLSDQDFADIAAYVSSLPKNK